MKYLASQLTHFLSEPEARKNIGALIRYLLVVLGVILVYSVVFHFIMLYAENQRHSWLTGFYWTLTVMSTLGFGDITFHSDIGRMFSIVVLLSGVVLLLIMLPFTFIRYFYAPWIEAQLRLQAPRRVPPHTRDHVIICTRDTISRGLIRKLKLSNIPYYVLEPDPVVAAHLASEDVSVVTGEIDGASTYEGLCVDDARLVFANAEDTTNSCVALTVREISAGVPIVALAEHEDSIDILELSGATDVLPLKRKLGEQLATRVKAGGELVQVTGRFKDVRIGEFLAHDTSLVGKTLLEARLRQQTGVNVVGVRERGAFRPVTGDLVFSDHAVPVVIGTEEQLEQLGRFLGPTIDTQNRPVLVIGGGKVGQAAARALRDRGISVRIVEKSDQQPRALQQVADDIIIGDAADREVLFDAGLKEASAVVLTTNDDATNIYLTVYCRRLNPDVNIVSRVTLERNIDAIYRAGADSVLSYASLGQEHLMAVLQGRDPILVGEGADCFLVPVPRPLVGKTLEESKVGAQTGLIVIAIEDGDTTITNPSPSLQLEAESRMLMLGTSEQRQTFAKLFG